MSIKNLSQAFYILFFYSISLQAELTIEEKVGQLIMAHFNGETVNDDARRLINKGYIGGIIYYEWSNSLNSPQQVQQLSHDLQKLTLANPHPIPLLISVDQEGGIVNRLQEQFTAFPGSEALGRTKMPALAEASAYACGQELRAVGVNLNFSPIVDVRSDRTNPSFRTRSYGNTPEVVVTFAKAALAGFEKGNLISTLKHFPGLGDVFVDPHQGLPILNKSLEELTKWEFIPYEQLKSQADVIMTAHVLIPPLDECNCATLSKTILDLLRNQIGFKGVIISDSLIMQGVLDNGGGLEETVVRAFLAGCDLLLLGGKQLLDHQTGFELNVEDVLKIHQLIVSKVKSGEISEKRLDASVQRILHLKKSHGLDGPSFPDDCDLIQRVGTKQHADLASAIARHSVKLVRYSIPLPIHLEGKKGIVIAPERIKKQLLQTSLSQMDLLFFRGSEPSEAEWLQAYKRVSDQDVIFVLSCHAWNAEKPQRWLRLIQNMGKIVIGMSLCDAEAVNFFPEEGIVLATYSPVAASIEAAFNLIK